MEPPAKLREVIRFGDFELRLSSAELTKYGLRIKLQEQPFQILIMLLERPGQVVTREELRARLWPGNKTFVDFEVGLNSAVLRLRNALGDTAENPRFIETVPRRGYRFIGTLAGPEALLESIQNAPKATTSAHIAPLERKFLEVDVDSPARSRRKRVWITMSAASALVALGALAGVILHLFQNSGPTVDPLKMTVRRITEDGRITSGVAISRDGRYAAYVTRAGKGGNRSLHVKQLASGSDVEVVAPGLGAYESLRFSADGNYIYYTHTATGNIAVFDLFSVPTLGGPSRHVLTNVHSPVAFSPDGAKFAFLRNSAGQNSELFVANSDGSNPQLLFSENGAFLTAPSWFSRRDLIVIGVLGSKSNRLLALDPHGKIVKSFAYESLVWNPVWMPDGTGIFFLTSPRETNRGQLIFQPYPKGEPIKFTNDLDNYWDFDISGDSNSLVAGQSELSQHVFVGASRTVGQFDEHSLKEANFGQDDGTSLSWTRDGKLLFTDLSLHLFIANVDGSARVQLASERSVMDVEACGSSDQAVVRVWLGNYSEIFLLNLTSEELKQLTSVKNAWGAKCTPDSRELVYASFDSDSDNIVRIRKMAVSGGTSIELGRTDIVENIIKPAISPDGKLVAYIQKTGDKVQYVVQNIDGDSPLHILKPIDSPVRESLQGWTPDGRALMVTSGSDSQLFLLPISGAPPQQITHFQIEPASVAAAAWSHDGKSIAITRTGMNNRNAVLFTNFRKSR
jgi:DNA-binding winged helix-turn-helix (wHTH) protein/Tol biopolymer transport system component